MKLKFLLKTTIAATAFMTVMSSSAKELDFDLSTDCQGDKAARFYPVVNGEKYILTGYKKTDSGQSALSRTFFDGRSQFGGGGSPIDGAYEVILGHSADDGWWQDGTMGKVVGVTVNMQAFGGDATLNVGVRDAEGNTTYFNGNNNGTDAVTVAADGYHNYFFIGNQAVEGNIVFTGRAVTALFFKSIKVFYDYGYEEITSASIQYPNTSDALWETWGYYSNTCYMQQSESPMYSVAAVRENGTTIGVNLGVANETLFGGSDDPIGPGVFSLNVRPWLYDVTQVSFRGYGYLDCEMEAYIVSLDESGNEIETQLKPIATEGITINGNAVMIPWKGYETGDICTFNSATPLSGYLRLKGRLISDKDNAENGYYKWMRLRSIDFVFDHETVSTGVDNVAVDAEPECERYYDLYGRPVDDSYKGIVIGGGKKILRR